MYHKHLDECSVVMNCERYGKSSAEETMRDLMFHTLKDKCRMLMKGSVLLRATMNVHGTRLSVERELSP
jgi:hypothetical protein